MHPPARWKDDPDCGHLVAHPYQTHYCTYTRVPKLLSLQRPPSRDRDEILAILSLQAIELWLKVIASDVRAALAEIREGHPLVYEPAKLLQRASRLIRLLDRHCDLAETILLQDLHFRIPLADPTEMTLSPQLFELHRLTADLEGRIASTDHVDMAYLRDGRDYLLQFGRWSERYRRLLEDLFTRGSRESPTFAEYLALPTLLDLQQGVKGDWAPIGQAPQRVLPSEPVNPDELMFIIVHQVFELWFHALLHELDLTRAGLLSDAPDVPQASIRMRRVVRVQTLLAEMIHIPATMLPMDFLKFRSQARTQDGVAYERGLAPASGTESYQFRELEIMAGLKTSAGYQEFLEGNNRMHTRFLTPAQTGRLQQPDLPEAFEQLLTRRGVRDPLTIFAPADAPNPHADLAELADRLLQFDQFFQLWRMNHLTMVQSMIGRKSGTGFLGPEYLKETVGMGLQAEDDRLLTSPQVRSRFFEKLWDARTRMGTYDRIGPAGVRRTEADG